MRENKQTRRGCRESHDDTRSRSRGWLRTTALGLAAALAVAGGLEAASIEPGTFVFDTSAPGLLTVSQEKLELEACSRAPFRTHAVGGLSNVFAPGEIIDINANMNIQGMMANPNNNGVVATAPLHFRSLSTVDLGSGEGTADVMASRFCMETVTPVTLSCGDFDVVLTLDSAATQTKGRFVLTADQTGGGSFTSEVEVSLTLHLTNTRGGSTVQVPHVVSYASSGQWAYAPGSGGAAEPAPFWVDEDCDGVDDVLVPGTPDFFPGWTPSGMQTEVTFTDLEKGGYLRLEPPLSGR